MVAMSLKISALCCPGIGAYTANAVPVSGSDPHSTLDAEPSLKSQHKTANLPTEPPRLAPLSPASSPASSPETNCGGRGEMPARCGTTSSGRDVKTRQARHTKQQGSTEKEQAAEPVHFGQISHRGAAGKPAEAAAPGSSLHAVNQTASAERLCTTLQSETSADDGLDVSKFAGPAARKLRAPGMSLPVRRSPRNISPPSPGRVFKPRHHDTLPGPSALRVSARVAKSATPGNHSKQVSSVYSAAELRRYFSGEAASASENQAAARPSPRRSRRTRRRVSWQEELEW